ncbi:tigger transposable element-derived protein 4 [Nephila pilipes]|uniref:Tigger transposable element-derived protein 4 n=1 Tax=Nephila pilipes TaxID=299642 RepID=A0A8X6QLV3_NEPPI|nr:tigger transposable element-derived protein 4 [Nephila pilipes]
MTSEICENWIQKLDKRKVKELRKIALLLDNFPANLKEINPKLKNVTVSYLSPNTTSKLHPMDQGVIKKNFKVHYRKRILRKVITALENNQSMPNINLREKRVCRFDESFLTTIRNIIRNRGKNFSPDLPKLCAYNIFILYHPCNVAVINEKRHL